MVKDEIQERKKATLGLITSLSFREAKCLDVNGNVVEAPGILMHEVVRLDTVTVSQKAARILLKC